MRIPISPFFVAEMASLLLASCVNVEIAPQQFPYEAMIAATDLGPGWRVEQTSFPQVEGALSSYGLTLRHGASDDATEPFVAYQLTVYPDNESAKTGYTRLHDEFNLSRPSDPILDVHPQFEDDLSDSHCERVKINDQARVSCVWLQQHRTGVSLILALVDGQALTFEAFAGVVQTLDARLGLLDGGRFGSG